ncbi:redox-sensitive transcriptional activator SoxR [Qingshengfaniella alkalisoli]|uniref:Redox-sensitive transcriptional activator SoxR n=1 Tax=Qingshengfaniella alkalisoli TaxID=2599296 RepID=A0A5B8JC54_9RHOB|nr:redox-sensitive transcriptional activator SoxR [Qingshengfaniella alkalisoli]QDY71690.1 redox-sensitive transcriptional activator SoxR [Qingshengfaniella alkalisoli]
MEPVLTMQQMVRRSGVEASALRYYESLGLIAAERSGGGQRRFPRSMLRRVAFIVFAQRVGLSLDEIGRELAKLPTGRVPKGEDWSRLSENWTSRIDERIAELRRLKAGLTDCISCGCLSLDQCALSNPDDRAGRLGPGPRYWLGQRSMKTL